MRRWPTAALQLLLCLIVVCMGCRSAAETRGRRDERPPTFLKGQLHAHTGRSSDSRTPPEAVARWYENHGFDFIVLTDHNVVTRLPWTGQLLVIPGVELTQNLRTCDPAPPPEMSCLLHVNALFVEGDLVRTEWDKPAASQRRVDLFQHALDATSRLGGLAQIDHPNFHYAADAALLSELARRGALLLEIANEAVDSNNQGDPEHPSTEALWDAVLSAGGKMYGVATDDAHHYEDAESVRAAGDTAFTGDRGYVMVRAERDPGAIRAALERGDFYSSTGVHLAVIAVTSSSIEIEAADGAPGPLRFDFVGSKGRVLQSSSGRKARFALDLARPGYVRAVVTNQQGRRAWTQPVFVP